MKSKKFLNEIIIFITCGCFALMLNITAFLVAGQILFNNPHIFYVLFMSGVFVNIIWCIIFTMLINKYLRHLSNGKDV